METWAGLGTIGRLATRRDRVDRARFGTGGIASLFRQHRDSSMLFHSLEYILFLAMIVTGFWALANRDRSRLALIFLASCRFYMFWNPYYIGLILGSAVMDWFVGRKIHAAVSQRARKSWLMVSIVGNLGALGLFKYYNFFAQSFQDGLGLVGVQVSAPLLNVLLPVGISFYTFQTMSYTIDVYRKRFEPEKSLLRYASFLTFFPQLVAGPIVRAGDLLPELRRSPSLDPVQVGEGLFLILRGLIKKVVIADFLGINLVDRVFDNPAAFTSLEVLVGLYAYTMQIYCDFSGYTDVARGSARLMGIRLPENFDRPYKATSPAEFWRRWHMTLSSWLRDYVYFPLGGSKGGTFRTYWNLWLTLFLIGIWHGAGWNFVIYGALHGFAMVVHRYFYKRSGRTKDTVDARWLIVLKIAATFHFVVLSRILFRSRTLESAGDVTTQLFQGSVSLAQISPMLWVILLAAFAVHWAPRGLVTGVKDLFVRLPAPVQGLVMAGVGALVVKMASSQVVPYIYFQF